MFTHLHDPKLVQDYHTEYFKLINYYSNVTRNAVYVKYYNINRFDSTFHDDLESTYDIYTISNVTFDLYDLTPAFYIQPVQNRSTNVTDLKGQQMDGASSIIVYTLQRPKIHDVLTFYAPTENSEIFRVANISTPTNALHATPSVNFFELELEYAPIKDTKALKMNKRYVYDISREQYVEYSQYTEYIQKLERYKLILDDLLLLYDEQTDLYKSDDLIPIVVNEILILFKRQFFADYERIFESYPFPFGYTDLISEQYYPNLESFPFSDLTDDTYLVYNLSTEAVEEYYWRDKDNPSGDLENALSSALSLWNEMSL